MSSGYIDREDAIRSMARTLWRLTPLMLADPDWRAVCYRRAGIGDDLIQAHDVDAARCECIRRAVFEVTEIRRAA